MVKTSIKKGVVTKDEYSKLRLLLLNFSIKEDSFIVLEKK